MTVRPVLLDRQERPAQSAAMAVMDYRVSQELEAQMGPMARMARMGLGWRTWTSFTTAAVVKPIAGRTVIGRLRKLSSAPGRSIAALGSRAKDMRRTISLRLAASSTSLSVTRRHDRALMTGNCAVKKVPMVKTANRASGDRQDRKAARVAI